MSWIEDVRASLAGLDASPRALRRFGLAVGAALIALAAWLTFRDRAGEVRELLAGAGLALMTLGALAPRSLRRTHRTWMALAFALGWVMSRVALTLLFALVVTPLALAARLAGKRFLGEKPADSYWVRREPGRPTRYDRMY